MPRPCCKRRRLRCNPSLVNADQYLLMALLPQIRLRSFFFMFFCAAVGLTCATSPQIEDPLLTSRGIYVPHLNIHYGILVAASTAVIVGLVQQARFIAKSPSAELSSADSRFGQWCAIYWRLAIALVVFFCLIVRLLVSRQILPEAQHDYYPEHVFPEAIILASIIIVLTASISRFADRTARQKRSFVIRILVPMLVGVTLLLVALANMGFMPSLLHIATRGIEMGGQLRFRRPGAFPDQAANGFRLFWLSLATLVAVILAAVGLACVFTAELTRSARLALMTIWHCSSRHPQYSASGTTSSSTRYFRLTSRPWNWRATTAIGSVEGYWYSSSPAP